MSQKPISSLGIEDAFNWHLAADHGISVKEFGAVGDGANDDTNAIQKAITAAIATGGSVLFPAGNYLVGTGLDLSGARTGITLFGQGRYRTFITWTGTGGNIFDLVHSHYVKMSDFTIQTGAGKSAAVGILMGRNASGNSSGNHVLRDVIVQGVFSKAGIYSCSSEVNIFDGVHVYNSGGAGTYAYYHSDANGLSIASAYQTLTALTSNATCAIFIGGSFMNWHAAGGEVMFFKNIVNLTMHGTNLMSAGTPAVGLITFDGTTVNATIDGIRMEGTPSYGIRVLGTGAITNSKISGYFAGTVAMIYGETGSNIRFSELTRISPNESSEIINADTLNGCVIDLITFTGTVRTSAQNNIWYNATETEPNLTGGIGNIRFSRWDPTAPRMVMNNGGLWNSDLGLGDCGATAGTTLGSVAKKIPVYNNSGAFVGYIPIYDTIT